MVFSVNIALIWLGEQIPSLCPGTSLFVIASSPGPFRCQLERLGMGLGMRLYKLRYSQGKGVKEMSQFCLRANLCVCGGATTSQHAMYHSVYHLVYTSCDTHRFSSSLSLNERWVAWTDTSGISSWTRIFFRIESKLVLIPRMSAHPLFEPNVRCTAHGPFSWCYSIVMHIIYHEEYMHVLLLSLHSCF